MCDAFGLKKSKTLSTIKTLAKFLIMYTLNATEKQTMQLRYKYVSITVKHCLSTLKLTEIVGKGAEN